MDKIAYYGTTLSAAGHYMYELMGHHFTKSEFNYLNFWEQHFNPETIADDHKIKQNGNVFYFRKGKWTICYIEGSCIDTRCGSKSVFFTDEKLTFGELVVKMVSIAVVRKIIKQMPFKVDFHLNEQFTEIIEKKLAE